MAAAQCVRPFQCWLDYTLHRADARSGGRAVRKMQVFPIGWFELTGEASLEAQRKLRIAAIAPDAAAATMAAFAIGAAAAAAVLLAPPVAGQDAT